MKNLSFKKSKKTVGDFYTSIQKIAEQDNKKKASPYQYLEFNDIFNKKIKKNLISKSNIIDIGCGYFGGFLPYIKKKNYHNLFACDINPYTVANLKKNYKFIKVKKGSCLNLPYPDKVFDLVICYGVIHHTHNYKLAIKELSRVLKKKGTLFLGVYAFDNSFFEYLIKLFRFVGRLVKYEIFQMIAKVWPLFNRFFMDHTYVPILYLISRNQIIKFTKKCQLELVEDFSSKTDFFQKIPILGKLISGDGLLRIYIFKKFTHGSKVKK
jgi:ubiquinone/menaquinone biosynthesis C-methylase UbiE